MTLRGRLTLVAAVAVAVAIALASAVAYVAVRGELVGQVDDALLRRAAVTSLAFGELDATLDIDPAGYVVQVVLPTGRALHTPTETISLPVSDAARDVAAGRRDGFFSDRRISGVHVRVLTVPLRRGIALQVARPLDEVDRVLRRLGLVLLLVVAGGIGLAAALGWMVARAALSPVHRLTEAAERVAQTRDLAHRIESAGSDELGRLAASFNSMLEALDSSLSAQRQLVADASHELRTPLTSLRTNIDVLTRTERLPADQRSRILSDISTQLEELTVLLGDLIDLARNEERTEAAEEVRLDRVVEVAAERVRARWPGVRFSTELEPTLVRGVPARLERAVGNLLDNAGKWSPPGGDVEAHLAGGELVVRDHGPGIASEDLPFVFDRFYRSPAARQLPGSGLGLAIVRQVAETHGGSVHAEVAEDGGARLRFVLPAIRFSPSESMTESMP
ncbi:MAG: ATP-binding protein [Actinomycetota bacterium]